MHTPTRQSDAMAFLRAQARKLLPSGPAAAQALGFDLDGAGHFLSGLWQLVETKTAECAAYVATHLAAALARKQADEPPLPPPAVVTSSAAASETLRSSPLRLRGGAVALPAAALGLGALALLCLARRRRGTATATMAAPGRGGARMPRDVFVGDPRGYFRDLRARKPRVY
ncbi:hypothetical protein ACP4OV_028486 [Aristida adscensionis]